MRWLLILLALLAGHVHAQIYRCDTDTGVEFSDQPCGESATVVHVEDSTSGIKIGPPDAVREQLAARKVQRAEAREQRRQEAVALELQRASAPQQVIVEVPRFSPGYWWRPNRPNRPNHPNRPGGPDRPHQPPTHRPLPTPVPPQNGGNMVLKPRP